MRSELTDSVTMSLTSEDPRAIGVQRSFNSFTAAAVENAESRLFLGVHYRFDAEDGLATGFAVGERAHTQFLTAVTCQPLPCW